MSLSRRYSNISDVRFGFKKVVHVVLFSFLFFAVFGCSEKESGLTFIVAGDLHYGLSDSLLAYNSSAILSMNDLPDTFPADNQHVNLQDPSGVILAGDLTESGEASQWSLFTEDYGIHGEKKLEIPVFEGFGNHDGPIEGSVRLGIKERNTKRKGLSSISENELHYSWQWQDVHFVQLNSYPSYEWDPGCEWCHYFEESFREPEQSLQFLERDLEANVGNSGMEVILIFHYGFDEWGNKWWTEDEQEMFYEVIAPYNVLAIFHGHTHTIQFYNWKEIPVFSVGSTQKDDRPGEYMVAHIGREKMVVYERRIQQGWGDFRVLNRIK